jgi:hypothetical protein
MECIRAIWRSLDELERASTRLDPGAERVVREWAEDGEHGSQRAPEPEYAYSEYVE